MATEQEVKDIMDKMFEFRQDELFNSVNKMKAGIGAVLKYLYEHQEETVTAGNLSDFLHVSTARVAVILKKMETKGLIYKGKGIEDGRVTIVQLSEHGLETVNWFEADLYRKINNVIDNIGKERLDEFIEIGKKIHKYMGSAPDVEL